MQSNQQKSVVQPIVTTQDERFPELLSQATNCWSFWLPFPLSSNNLFAHRIVPGRSRVVRYPTSAYKRWRREAEVRICAARIPRMVEPVVIKLALTPPNNRRRDADNFGKGVLDALVAARVLPDDNMQWVRAVIPYWCDPHKPTSGVVVTIRIAKLTGLFAAGGVE